MRRLKRQSHSSSPSFHALLVVALAYAAYWVLANL